MTRGWTRVFISGPAPAGRYGHAVAMVGSRFYVFGGQVDGEFLNDLWAFDLNTRAFLLSLAVINIQRFAWFSEEQSTVGAYQARGQRWTCSKNGPHYGDMRRQNLHVRMA